MQHLNIHHLLFLKLKKENYQFIAFANVDLTHHGLLSSDIDYQHTSSDNKRRLFNDKLLFGMSGWNQSKIYVCNKKFFLEMMILICTLHGTRMWY